MAVTLKCAACGAQVEFEELYSTSEVTCPGCQVKVRYRECDEQMAIPVSMALPEEFAPADLSSVADKSALLVERYKRQKPASRSTKDDTSDLVLAKALKALADSVGILDERLTRQEGKEQLRQGEDGGVDPQEENSSAAVAAATEDGSRGKDHAGESDPEVVHLGPQEADDHAGNAKADPVDARVLVRSEAAQIAHAFQRERHGQEDWMESASDRRRAGGFSWLVSNYPKRTMMVGAILLASLSVSLILWTANLIAAGNKTGENQILPSSPSMGLSRLMEDDPEAGMAETVARGYLNATSAQAALPFVWEADIIRDKFARYFVPLSQPDSYELTLQDRAIGNDGKPQFLYTVTSPGERPRRLLLLPEGAMPKVFWEFFEEVGEMTWEDFLSKKPQGPTEMRVWVHPVEIYLDGYESEKWQAYVLHDQAERHRVLAYAPRDLGDDWQISDALQNQPVTFNRHEAVMALLVLRHKTKIEDQAFSGVIAEIEDVVATSWLPDRFRSGSRE